jgi:hypothetical protein
LGQELAVDAEQQRQCRLILRTKVGEHDAFVIRQHLFGTDPSDGRGFPLDDRHTKRMQGEPFDHRFLDPWMSPHSFCEIRQAHLVLGDSFFECQSLEYILSCHLMHPLNPHLSDLETSLKHRTDLTRQKDRHPAHDRRSGEPSSDTQHGPTTSDHL